MVPAMQMDNGLDLSGLSRDPQVEKIYSIDPLVHSKISARWAMDMLNNGQYIIEHAGEFPIPLLLMVGSTDRIINVKLTEEFAHGVPISKITFRKWDGFYHELHNEPEKAKVIEAMIDWLDLRLK